MCRSLGVVFAVWDSGAARNRWVPGRLPEVCCGGVLLSHNLSVAVPLALPGLASRFGMEAGRFPGAMTTTSLVFNTLPPLLVCWGVWVDRDLYSGCGSVVDRCCFTRVLCGCCLVLAH